MTSFNLYGITRIELRDARALPEGRHSRAL